MTNKEYYIKYYYGNCFYSTADKTKTIYTFGDIIIDDCALILFKINGKNFVANYPISNIITYVRSNEWKISITETRRRKLKLLKND
jgi:hypothetical protein